MRQGPFAGRYPAVAAMVMFALIPYLVLSAALNPLSPIIASDLHMSQQTISLGLGLGNAAYALGTVLAVQFAQHLPQRRMLVLYAALLVVGSVLAADAQGTLMFITGHVIQGLCTSLLLIAAAPPLAIGFPKDKLRDTAVIMNMCIFGAVALGPFIGGLQAEADAWRPLFWIVAGISLIALLLAVLTFEDSPPANPDSPRDLLAIGLATFGCVAAFFGASQLTSHSFSDPVTIVPLVLGLAAIVTLIVYQFRAPATAADHPAVAHELDPGRRHRGCTVRGSSVSVVDRTHRRRLVTPLQPGPHRCAVPARAPRRRHHGARAGDGDQQAILALSAAGSVMVDSPAGIAVFRIEVPPSQALTLVGSTLTGLGLGATVAPALFVAGFSLTAASLQRVFAIVELLRAVAAFMVAPIFVYFASTVSSNLDTGTSIALWIGLAIAISGIVVSVGIYLLSGARPQRPDLDVFLEGTKSAWYSPPLLARVWPGKAVAIPDVPVTEGID